MLRFCRWAVLLIAVFVCTFGAMRTRIFEQPIWDPVGLYRLLIYTAVFAMATCLFFFSRRTLFVRCFFVATAFYTVALTGAKVRERLRAGCLYIADMDRIH